jgi:hypothetical protein
MTLEVVLAFTHGCQLFNLQVMDFCRRRKIILLFLPSKMTWCFQPLDVGVFHSFHQACSRLLAVCTAQNYTVNRNTIVPLYAADAHRISFQPDLIRTAFRTAGLYPPNRGVFVCCLCRAHGMCRAHPQL